MQIKHHLLFFSSDDMLRYFSKWSEENMKVSCNPKCWDWKAWEERGKRSKSLGGKHACTSTQHTGVSYILQWRKSMETPNLLPSSMEQPLLLCLQSRLKPSLTFCGCYCCVMCSHTLLDCSSGLFIKQARKDGENHIITRSFKEFQSFQSFWAGKSP